MARKESLRTQRANTILNVTSKGQEKEINQALLVVISNLKEEFPNIGLEHVPVWKLKDIVGELRTAYPAVDFHYHFETSGLKPDGGMLRLVSREDASKTYPILIAEVKNQGTNDLRKQENLPRQAKGNAIERLGKNVIGLRTALMRESIFPFVCFGYGCDFEKGSSILDRVSTIAQFGRLNETHLHAEEDGRFFRGSFYFREERWTPEEMAEVMTDISKRAILYYFSRYREDRFLLS